MASARYTKLPKSDPLLWVAFGGATERITSLNMMIIVFDFGFTPIADMILKLSELGSAGCGKCLGRGKLALCK